MTDAEFRALKRGDIVRHLHTADSYLVDMIGTGVIVAFRTITITPSDHHSWAKYEPDPPDEPEMAHIRLIKGWGPFASGYTMRLSVDEARPLIEGGYAVAIPGEVA
jgi:hypothetical protein